MGSVKGIAMIHEKYKRYHFLIIYRRPLFLSTFWTLSSRKRNKSVCVYDVVSILRCRIHQLAVVNKAQLNYSERWTEQKLRSRARDSIFFTLGNCLNVPSEEATRVHCYGLYRVHAHECYTQLNMMYCDTSCVELTCVELRTLKQNYGWCVLLKGHAIHWFLYIYIYI